MGQSWFSWNGVDCRSMGVIMTAPAAIIRPEERAQHIEIPGRAGDLTQTEGENIFNSYIQTVSFTVPDSLARTEDAANFAPEAAGVQTGRTGRP